MNGSVYFTYKCTQYVNINDSSAKHLHHLQHMAPVSVNLYLQKNLYTTLNLSLIRRSLLQWYNHQQHY